ncbi:MAG: uroporphyrinogen-III C-methyltransferase [Alphaproteobacteria bacterium]|nr:uroporphyrinogen-III C-methyltransferase [Alphaproteobacteria bacterium]
MESLPFALPEFLPGHVWLVGAGPGDPGLLSLLALHALRHADVVVYDALVDRRVLDLIRDGAERVDVGKRGGTPSPKQPEISDKLVTLARRGLRVLRLKGGDPFLFGRGSEEAAALRAAETPFRVVPGITSGIAGPAYAGIPVTSRDVNSAVTFITGHDGDGDVPRSLDWAAISRASPVLVFYMALRRLAPISRELIAAGRPASQPVAVICEATTERQTVLETTLERLAEDVASHGLKPPAIVVVGDVVRLRSLLDWH